MTLLVQKYGGTSVASVERIQAVAEKVAASRKAGNQLVVVLSAMSGVTNKLLGWAHQVQADPSAREMDVLLSTGEQTTIALLSNGSRRVRLSGTVLYWRAGKILTDDAHTKARKLMIEQELIRNLDHGKLSLLLDFKELMKREKLQPWQRWFGYHRSSLSCCFKGR